MIIMITIVIIIIIPVLTPITLWLSLLWFPVVVAQFYKCSDYMNPVLYGMVRSCVVLSCAWFVPMWQQFVFVGSLFVSYSMKYWICNYPLFIATIIIIIVIIIIIIIIIIITIIIIIIINIIIFIIFLYRWWWWWWWWQWFLLSSPSSPPPSSSLWSPSSSQS